MRILPDRHFKQSFSQHYNENYEKIVAKRTERNEIKQQNRKADSGITKYKIIGGIATVFILGSFFLTGIWVSSVFKDKEQKAAELEVSIVDVDNQIKKYQVVNGSVMHEQLDEVLTNVTAIQNEYTQKGELSNTASIADRYLGNFNNDWSAGEDVLENPSWCGYLNKAQTFDDTAEYLFILYDAKVPKMIAVVKYNIDENGNVGTLSSVRKTWLE